MKHSQKMVMIPEHLMQSIETEHRLTAPAQLMTLTRLDQDMKQIMDSSFPEDQKVLLLDHLLQRYQGLTKQMKSEVTVKPFTQNVSHIFSYSNFKCKYLDNQNIEKARHTFVD